MDCGVAKDNNDDDNDTNHIGQEDLFRACGVAGAYVHGPPLTQIIAAPNIVRPSKRNE